MLVPINVTHLHRKVRCKEQGSKQFQSKKKKNQDLVLNLTHMLMCAEDDSFILKKEKKKRKRLPQGSKVIIFA